jgi:hypothetical protein
MTLIRALSVVGSATVLCLASCGDYETTGSTPVPECEGTSGTGGVAGTGGTGEPAGPCPEGFNCVDLGMLGATAVDGSGNPVTASCGNGAASAACDDADPASTCPGLTNPICAHVSIAGTNVVSCGQRCTP